jgi:hypothetical protein
MADPAVFKRNVLAADGSRRGGMYGDDDRESINVENRLSQKSPWLDFLANRLGAERTSDLLAQWRTGAFQMEPPDYPHDPAILAAPRPSFPGTGRDRGDSSPSLPQTDHFSTQLDGEVATQMGIHEPSWVDRLAGWFGTHAPLIPREMEELERRRSEGIQVLPRAPY